MNIIPASAWSQVEPRIREAFPRLTPGDFAEADRRLDLLTAKVQNRHWVARDEALGRLLGILRDAKLV